MKTLPITLLTALLLAGCDSPPNPPVMPEVNDANCTLESIMQIQDKSAREQFASQCSHRSGAIQKTERPKNWLELNRAQG